MAWNEVVAKALRSSREELKGLLEGWGIPPAAAEEFLCEAISSVPPDQWLACSDPALLLIQTVKTNLRSGSSSIPKSRLGGRMSKGSRRKERQRGAGGRCAGT